MKGILVDYNNSEGFLALEDGSIITLPLSTFNKEISIGDSVNIGSVYSNVNTYNNHTHTTYASEISDFF